MGGQPRWPRLARPAALAAALAFVGAAAGAPPASAGGWTSPAQIVSPFPLDVIAPGLAFSSAGVASIGFGVQDGGDASKSTGYLAARGVAGGPVALRPIPTAKDVLALAYEKDTLGLLLGTAPSNQTCCSAVALATRRPGGAVSAPHQLVGSLAGATDAQLLAVDGGLLAVIATERGVWYAQSAPRSTRFGASHRLTAGSAIPETVSATPLSGGGAAVLWAARGGGAGVTGAAPGWIVMASGSSQRAPGNPRVVIRLPSGHGIDELAAAQSATGVTVAWIESWFDGAGNFHSVARVADISRHTTPRTLSPAGELASGLSLVADGAGDQLVTWRGCTGAGTCVVRAARRPARGRFGAQQLSGIDSGDVPAAAIGSRGTSVVAWVGAGHVFAATAGVHARSFGGTARVSPTNYAANVTLGAAPTGSVLAVWTQGTYEQSIVGASLRVR